MILWISLRAIHPLMILWISLWAIHPLMILVKHLPMVRLMIPEAIHPLTIRLLILLALMICLRVIPNYLSQLVCIRRHLLIQAAVILCQLYFLYLHRKVNHIYFLEEESSVIESA